MTQGSAQQAPISLYDRLGGAPAVSAAVDGFYDRVLADDMLKSFFANSDPQELRRKQSVFMTYAFGGAPSYSGASMRAAHAGSVAQGLTDKHFDQVAGHLQDTLESLGLSDDLVSEVIGIVATTRDDVLGR